MKEEDYLWTVVKGRKIFFALDTFFQANLSILERIVGKIEGLIGWRNDTVFLDLYSGVGLFGIALADRAAEVIMIESVSDSVKLAHYNVRYHDLKQVKILEGQVETQLPEVLHELIGKPCVALIDPIERAVVPPSVAFFSSNTTLAPLLRAPIAAATPVPPPPTTTTSVLIFFSVYPCVRKLD